MYLTEKESKEQSEKIKNLERQVEACLIWIKNYTGVDMTIEDIVKSDDEPILTPKEMKEWERHITSLEVRSNMFHYFREEKGKMAERF